VKGEGKTLTSVNLSVAMSKDFDRRVLLVEVDFKNPGMSRLLGRKSGGGFIDVLSKQTDMGEVSLTFFDGRLTVLLAGKSMGDDLKLLGSEQAVAFLKQMRSRYDYIVLDLPPLLPLADAGVVTELADGVIMVIRAGHTPQHIVKRAMADLNSHKILGVVLNDVSSMLSYYYYYHHQTK
jgi:capsular exopolysaccharide synthesis family protein